MYDYGGLSVLLEIMFVVKYIISQTNGFIPSYARQTNKIVILSLN